MVSKILIIYDILNLQHYQNYFEVAIDSHTDCKLSAVGSHTDCKQWGNR